MIDSTGKSTMTAFNTTNGGLVTSSLTGTPDCGLMVPTNISATYGGNVDGISDGNSTSYLQKYNNGTQTFINSLTQYAAVQSYGITFIALTV